MNGSNLTSMELLGTWGRVPGRTAQQQLLTLMNLGVLSSAVLHQVRAGALALGPPVGDSDPQTTHPRPEMDSVLLFLLLTSLPCVHMLDRWDAVEGMCVKRVRYPFHKTRRTREGLGALRPPGGAAGSALLLEEGDATHCPPGGGTWSWLKLGSEAVQVA